MTLRSQNKNNRSQIKKASDCKCIKCGEQAEVFWPVIDPDIKSNPYCRKCVEMAKVELLIKMCEFKE